MFRHEWIRFEFRGTKMHILIRIMSLLAIALFPNLQPLALPQETEQVEETKRVGFESISAADALGYIEFLASDELEGRDTPSRGQKIARNYVATLYKLWGIAPAGDTINGEKIYKQEFPILVSKNAPGSSIEVKSNTGSRKFLFGSDFFIGWRCMGAGVIEAPVVFLGFGVSEPDLGYDDFKDVDLRGKIAIVLGGLPAGISSADLATKYRRLTIFPHLGDKLRQSGALAVLRVLPADYSQNPDHYFIYSEGKYKLGIRIEPSRHRVNSPMLGASVKSVPIFAINEQVADCILSEADTSVPEMQSKMASSLQPNSFAMDNVSVRIDVQAHEESDITGNVLGMIEGSDPELKKEYVLICAHLDHIGRTEDGYVFNGADDNASGSASLLEIAQAFAHNPVKPRRSVLFAHWTGEEKGHVGSRFFAEFPSVPLDSIVACLNADMIGRYWNMESFEASKHRFSVLGMEVDPNHPNFEKLVTVSLSAQSPELNEIFSRNNENHVGLYYYPLPGRVLVIPSDNLIFHRKRIPSALVFASLHGDYHTPADTFDKLNGDLIEKITRLLYLVAYEIADSPERMTWESN